MDPCISKISFCSMTINLGRTKDPVRVKTSRSIVRPACAIDYKIRTPMPW